MQSADDDGRAMFAAHDALERVHRLGLPVIDALKFRAVADRPINRKRTNTKHALQFVEQLQWIFHGAIALVHEGEDRHAALAANLEQLRVCGSMPFAESITITTASTAVSTR